MLQGLLRRRGQRRTAQNLYGSIVALARRPDLYERFGLPDTIEGRFEVLTAHMFVYLDRLSREAPEDAGIAQALVDAFFADMDTTQRELGVGDTAVPKKMRHLAAAFEGSMQAYKSAVGTDDPAPLVAAIGERMDTIDERALAGFAQYLKALHTALGDQALEAILAGEVPPSVAAARQ